jgi:hypothetical protein
LVFDFETLFCSLKNFCRNIFGACCKDSTVFIGLSLLKFNLKKIGWLLDDDVPIPFYG